MRPIPVKIPHEETQLVLLRMKDAQFRRIVDFFERSFKRHLRAQRELLEFALTHQHLLPPKARAVDQYARLTAALDAAARSPSFRRGAVERYVSKPSGGEWITIGGAPAMVDAGGSILAACPGLNGEDVEDLTDEEPESRQRRKVKQDVAESRGLTGHDLTAQQAHKLHTPTNAKIHAAASAAAKQHGAKVPDILAAVPGAHARQQGEHHAREGIKARARQLVGIDAGKIARMENAGKDHTDLPHFDEFAEELAAEFPELGLHREGADVSAAVWDLIREGKRTAPAKHHESVVDEAARQALPPKKVHPVTAALDKAFQSSPVASSAPWDTSDAEPQFEFFRRTGAHENYAGKKKPAAGQGGMNFDDDQPRDADGKFASGGGSSSPASPATSPAMPAPGPTRPEASGSMPTASAPHPLTQALDEAFQLQAAKRKGWKKAEFAGQERKVMKPLFIGADDKPGQQYLFGQPDDPLEDPPPKKSLFSRDDAEERDRYALRQSIARAELRVQRLTR